MKKKIFTFELWLNVTIFQKILIYLIINLIMNLKGQFSLEQS